MKCTTSSHGKETTSKTQTSCGRSLKESLATLEEQLFEAEQALTKEERDTLKLILKRKVNALKMTIKALKKR